MVWSVEIIWGGKGSISEGFLTKDCTFDPIAVDTSMWIYFTHFSDMEVKSNINKSKSVTEKRGVRGGGDKYSVAANRNGVNKESPLKSFIFYYTNPQFLMRKNNGTNQ